MRIKNMFRNRYVWLLLGIFYLIVFIFSINNLKNISPFPYESLKIKGGDYTAECVIIGFAEEQEINRLKAELCRTQSKLNDLIEVTNDSNKLVFILNLLVTILSFIGATSSFFQYNINQ